jgi:hypothetical protein
VGFESRQASAIGCTPWPSGELKNPLDFGGAHARFPARGFLRSAGSLPPTEPQAVAAWNCREIAC